MTRNVFSILEKPALVGKGALETNGAKKHIAMVMVSTLRHGNKRPIAMVQMTLNKKFKANYLHNQPFNKC